MRGAGGTVLEAGKSEVVRRVPGEAVPGMRPKFTDQSAHPMDPLRGLPVPKEAASTGLSAILLVAEKPWAAAEGRGERAILFFAFAR